MKPTPRISVERGRERGDDRQRRHEVGEVGHVDVDADAAAPERSTVVPIGGTLDTAAHRREQIGERRVALQRRRAETGAR